MRLGELGAGAESLIDAYQRPMPNLSLGQQLAPHVSAMADVSDGLLIDAARIAEASGVAMALMLDAVPLSDAYLTARPEGLASRLAAVTAGDDYRLLFTAPVAARAAIAATSLKVGGDASRIGQCTAGRGITLSYRGDAVPLPVRLGFEHGEN
jgi:thiamine-monophosphate kinase